MFKRKNRLIPGIKFSKSRPISTPQFVLKEKENNMRFNRYGIIVSKNVDKRAVVRNQIKRLIRATLIILEKKMSVGHDILFMVKNNILTKTKKENTEEIAEILKKAKIIEK